MSVYCLIGHSASGKSTLEKRLELMGFDRIISYTTRSPRKNEKNGVDYHFISTEEFIEMDNQRKFQETAKYREWYYGMSLEGIDYKNKDYIFVATIHGYEELLKSVEEGHVVAIHVKVDERERLRRLVERGDDIDEAIRRIYADREDFREVEEVCNYIVDNERVDLALVDVYNIIKTYSSAK